MRLSILLGTVFLLGLPQTTEAQLFRRNVVKVNVRAGGGAAAVQVRANAAPRAGILQRLRDRRDNRQTLIAAQNVRVSVTPVGNVQLLRVRTARLNTFNVSQHAAAANLIVQRQHYGQHYAQQVRVYQPYVQQQQLVQPAYVQQQVIQQPVVQQQVVQQPQVIEQLPEPQKVIERVEAPVCPPCPPCPAPVVQYLQQPLAVQYIQAPMAVQYVRSPLFVTTPHYVRSRSLLIQSGCH